MSALHELKETYNEKYGEDSGYDLISLPMWLVRITDDVAEGPGVFAAYPEELFEEED